MQSGGGNEKYHVGQGATACEGFDRVRAAIPLGIAALVGLPLVLAAGTHRSARRPRTCRCSRTICWCSSNRDFVTVEGFADHVGQSGTLEVTRPGVGVVGSAVGVVSGGDVAFEVNHPGGYCWGAGTGLNVTPDIIPGDVVSLSFGGTRVAATTTLDVFANNAVQTRSTTVPSPGTSAQVSITANMEQRIIEPALVDTVIGKRDVRAVPGPTDAGRPRVATRRGSRSASATRSSRRRTSSTTSPMRRSRPMPVWASGRWPGSSSTRRATVKV